LEFVVFYILLLFALILLGCYPWFRAATLRCFFRSRLKRVCRIRKYRYIKKPRAPWRNVPADAPDLIVDTGDVLYALRLFAATQRRSALVFHSEGHSVCTRKKLPHFFRSGKKHAHYVMQSKHKALVPMRLPTALCKDKTVHFVLLLNPVCQSVLYQDAGQVHSVGNGDRVGSMRLLSAAALLKLLQDPLKKQ
jgi:hypothetical protein